jgi:hypothetical protein
MKNDQQHQTDSPETWLHQTLGGYSPETPADAWQRLAPHLPKRERRRPFVFWMSRSVVGIAAVIALYLLWKNVERPSETEVLAIQPMCERPGQVFDKIAPQANLKKFAQPLASPLNKNHISRKIDVQTPIKTAHFSSNNTSPAVSTPPEITLEFLPPKPLTSLVQTRPHLNVQFRSTNVFAEKTIRNQRFWFGIEASPTLLMQKNVGGMPVGLAFPEMRHHPGYGWQAGVSMAFEPLKNWRIGLGIQYVRQTHAARHDATLRLIDGICLNPNDPGLKEYEFRYAIVSGSEQNDLTLRLQQQHIGSMMPDDEPFTINMKSIHLSAAWRLPLTVERRFGGGKWQGFVRGGTAIDATERNKIEVAHYTEACQDLCFHNGHMPNIHASAPAGASVGWLAGAGIERQISRLAALRLEPYVVGKKGTIHCGLNLGLLFSK